MLHRLTFLAAAAAFALPAVTPTAAAAQDRPVTVKQVAKKVGTRRSACPSGPPRP
jgi:hypothetical protein